MPAYPRVAALFGLWLPCSHREYIYRTVFKYFLFIKKNTDSVYDDKYMMMTVFLGDVLADEHANISDVPSSRSALSKPTAAFTQAACSYPPDSF